jgi:ParB family chromosome partitioning protein
VVRVGEAYEMVAGRHRLAAAKQLGWSEIPAVVVELDDVDRLLAEIDENLIRNELRTLERSEHLAERKRLYLLKHPETAPVTQRGGPGRGQKTTADSATVSFAADTASKTGASERTVREDVQIAESIPEDVRDALRDTPLADSKTDLLDIARLPEEAQREVVQTADLTSKTSVREAVCRRRPTPAPAPVVAQEESEVHTTEVMTTVEAFAVAISSLFNTNERRRLIRMIADSIKEEAALSGN